MTLWIIGMIALRLLVLAAFIMAVYKLIRWLISRREARDNGRIATREKAAVRILKERFASGEISEAEYKNMKKVLET